MLRWLGMALTVLSSMGIGFYYSSLVKGRLEDLRDLKKTMLRLRGEIEYAGTPLPEAIASASSLTNKDFKAFYRILHTKLEQMDGKLFRSIWKECVEKELKDSCLIRKDKMELIKFGEGIGYLDKTMQIHTIDLYLSDLDQEIQKLNGEMEQKVKLYNMMGLMGGLFLIVLFF